MSKKDSFKEAIKNDVSSLNRNVDDLIEKRGVNAALQILMDIDVHEIIIIIIFINHFREYLRLRRNEKMQIMQPLTVEKLKKIISEDEDRHRNIPVSRDYVVYPVKKLVVVGARGEGRKGRGQVTRPPPLLLPEGLDTRVVSQML